MSDFRNISIIGIGLIGGSLGLALKEADSSLRVHGFDIKPGTAAQAQQMGIIDIAHGNLEEAVKEADAVFIATPVGEIVKVISKVLPWLRAETVITDVGSTKEKIVRRVEKALPEEVHFIGGHPMTGSEQEGFAHANKNLFKDSYYILTPTPKTDAKVYLAMHDLLTRIGSLVLALDPREHDEIMAVISHLPHILSSILVKISKSKSKKKESLLLLTAGGFKDMTRIAASNPRIWLDICLENRKAIRSMIGDYIKALEDFDGWLEEGDKEEIWGYLSEAREIRRGLPSRIDMEEKEIYELMLPVKDRPGSISQILLKIGSLGINIEDLDLIHRLEKKEGLLRILIKEKDKANRAKDKLEEDGFQVEMRNLELGVS